VVEYYKKRDFFSLLDFIKNYQDSDFYITENNSRLIVKDEKSLDKFIRQCRDIMIITDKGDVVGVICLWKSIGNNVYRYYIKLSAKDEKIADNLIKVLLWNTDKEVYVKIKKISKFLKIFKNNQFNFCGDRGTEVLLVSSKYRKIYDNYNNKSEEFNSRQ